MYKSTPHSRRKPAFPPKQFFLPAFSYTLLLPTVYHIFELPTRSEFLQNITCRFVQFFSRSEGNGIRVLPRRLIALPVLRSPVPAAFNSVSYRPSVGPDKLHTGWISFIQTGQASLRADTSHKPDKLHYRLDTSQKPEKLIGWILHAGRQTGIFFLSAAHGYGFCSANPVHKKYKKSRPPA